MATTKDLLSWIERDITRFGKTQNYIEFVEKKPDSHFDLKFRIYTDTHSYSISAVDLKPSRERSYLGCIASSRKPRAGEDWTRGNDLADGELTEETWHNILGDIISYEMVKIHRPKPAQADDTPPTVQVHKNGLHKPGCQESPWANCICHMIK